MKRNIIDINLISLAIIETDITANTYIDNTSNVDIIIQNLLQDKYVPLRTTISDSFMLFSGKGKIKINTYKLLKVRSYRRASIFIYVYGIRFTRLSITKVN